MSQYKRLFGTTRIPKKGQGECSSYLILQLDDFLNSLNILTIMLIVRVSLKFTFLAKIRLILSISIDVATLI